MKRVIRASSSLDDLSLGMITLVGQTWQQLINAINDSTQFTVMSESTSHPNQFIYLTDPDHNEYEAEVTKYSNGQYELRIDNIHKTGQKIESDSDIFSEDIFLPLEHAIDVAVDEAWVLFRKKNRSNPFVSDQARHMAIELEQIKKRVRNLRSFVNDWGE